MFGEALGGRDRANLEAVIECLNIHLKAVIERVERCTWRPRSSELRDALGGRDRVDSVMHWEAEIE